MVLLCYALLFLVLWLSATGPLRWVAQGTALQDHWFFGVAPNLFAGTTLSLWQAFGTRTGPFASAVLAVAVLGFVEILQLTLPQHRADGGDAVASLIGAVLIIWRRGRDSG